MGRHNEHQVWLILGGALSVASLFLSQASGQPVSVLNLPFGPITRLASPDGSLILYGVPFQTGVNTGPQLWLEDARTDQRQKLLDISDGVSAGWSPDGSKFYVLDHSSSDSTESYIYDARTLKQVDLGALIRKSDSSISRFASGHAYFDFDRWESPETVIVHFYGHTDEPPVVCFDLRYRVNLSGTTKKLEQQMFPPGSKSCRG